MRCIAMADMLRNSFECKFLIDNNDTALQVKEHLEKISYTVHCINESETPVTSVTDQNCILVLDGYHFDTDYQNRLKNRGVKLVYIDDIPLYPYTADLIINHAPGISKELYQAAAYTRFLLGSDYALLREPFLQAVRTNRKFSQMNTAIVNMGGADEHNITYKAARAILQSGVCSQVLIIIGASFPHQVKLAELEATYPGRVHIFRNLDATALAGLMQQAQLAICPASTISLELCAIGTGILCGYTASNQLNIYKGLCESACILPLGNLLSLTHERLMEQLYMINTDQLNQMVVNQRSLIDGQSTRRIREAIKGLTA
jgi:UDP-2,4-diacetamido-2,4,6-trideoxy-beta-L-altropyranose hydrolase